MRRAPPPTPAKSSILLETKSSAEETSKRFHMVMKREFTPALATSTHAALINSQSGCLLHKQIACDYSNLSSSDSVKTSLN